ncbi:DNA polymerase III subunit gamma/tau [candidate division WOR-3 bacterium]|nr:DNA polymerase III subunit gamma/tau [candidate division WOR-3 bacterium]
MTIARSAVRNPESAIGRSVLTLKYRPQRFDELLVQDHVRDTMKRAIEKNRLANAYLFCGPRGVGKTTTARILAKSLNCEKGPTAVPCNKCSFCSEIAASRSLDVIEIDGASNNSVNDVRELRENAKYTPSSGRFKIYIIDEVHMLSPSAFNALLKTLEEPPAHVKFVFATTEAHKVPATIVSRCQRFDFRRATPAEIKDRLAWLARQENIKASEAALMAIARRADGAIRDGEGILDQLAAYRPDGIELEDVEELLGLVPSDLFFDYADLVLAGDGPGLMSFIARLFESGYDHMEFYSGVVRHFRSLLVLEVSGRDGGLSLLPEEAERMLRQARLFDRGGLLRILHDITAYEVQAGSTQFPRVLLEVMSLELAAGHSSSTDTKAARDTSPSESDAPVASDRPVNMGTLWAELRLRTNKHPGMLAGFLDLATPVSFEHDTLTISLPSKQKAAAGKLEQSRQQLTATMTEIAGRPVGLVVHLTRKPSPDPTRERVSRILGEVDEKEQH